MGPGIVVEEGRLRFGKRVVVGYESGRSMLGMDRGV